MRARTVLFTLLAGSTVAVAQPGADLPPPEPPPEPVQAEPAPAPAPPAEPVQAAPEPTPAPEPAPAPAPVVVSPAAPGGAVPPITINITNNNNGNNSNTNTQTSSQANPQTNTQTSSQANPQTNTQTQTMTAPVNVTTSVAAPGAVAAQPGVRASVDHYELLRAKEKPAKWITLGVTSDLHGPAAGVRGSFDIIGRGTWSLGVAASISHDGDGRHGPARGGDGHGRPAGQAIGYIAWTGKLGRLDLRAQVGLGAGTRNDGDRGRAPDGTIARSTTGDPTTTDPSTANDRHGHPRLGMRAEAALLVGLPLGKHLGLVAGPVVSAGKPEAGEKAVSAQVMGGLRWGF